MEKSLRKYIKLPARFGFLSLRIHLQIKRENARSPTLSRYLDLPASQNDLFEEKVVQSRAIHIVDVKEKLTNPYISFRA